MTLFDFDASWDITRQLALIEELSNTTRMIELGVAEIHQLSGANDFHHGALQLLAQGYERLVKCTVVAAMAFQGQPLPDKKQIGDTWGHRLTDVHAKMVELIEVVAEYANRPVAAEDLEFMRNDPDLAALLNLLANFAGGGRYFDLDTVLGFNDGNPDLAPSRIWSELETQFWGQVSNGDALTDLTGAEVHRRIGIAIAGVLDRYSRAIARAWFLGALGPSGRAYGVGSVDRWNTLNDAELGIPREL